jgi:hypothetical protein
MKPVFLQFKQQVPFLFENKRSPIQSNEGLTIGTTFDSRLNLTALYCTIAAMGNFSFTHAVNYVHRFYLINTRTQYVKSVKFQIH